jgi:hypothetical protein
VQELEGERDKLDMEYQMREAKINETASGKMEEIAKREEARAIAQSQANDDRFTSIIESMKNIKMPEIQAPIINVTIEKSGAIKKEMKMR